MHSRKGLITLEQFTRDSGIFIDNGTRYSLSALVSTGFSVSGELTLLGCDRTFGDNMNIVVKSSIDIVPLGRETKNEIIASVPLIGDSGNVCTFKKLILAS